MTFSVQHLTAPLCSTKNTSSMAEPRPVLQTLMYFPYTTINNFYFLLLPSFLGLDDRHISYVWTKVLY